MIIVFIKFYFSELLLKYYIGDLTPETLEPMADGENVPVAFTSCFKLFKSKFGFK